MFGTGNRTVAHRTVKSLADYLFRDLKEISGTGILELPSFELMIPSIASNYSGVINYLVALGTS